MTHFQGWPRALADRLGIALPIVQGPFGGFDSTALVAEVSAFGGLGSIGANALAPADITRAIAAVRARTDRPFAVNLWVSTEDPGAATVDDAQLARALTPLAPCFAELGAPLPAAPRYAPMSFAAQARAVLDANVPVFSFICGVPPADVLAECRARRIATIGTATTPDEAVALADAGVDAIVASGLEAGGHRGSFLAPATDSLLGTFALVPQVVDAVPGVPVIAAGGIADGRGVRAALALGASGVQIGTRLLACVGSGATDAHRAALRTGRYTPTVLSAGFTGRLARGLANTLARTVQHAPYLPYPQQRALTKELTAAAARAGRTDLQQWWSGQAAGIASRDETATEVLRAIADDVP